MPPVDPQATSTALEAPLESTLPVLSSVPAVDRADKGTLSADRMATVDSTLAGARRREVDGEAGLASQDTVVDEKASPLEPAKPADVHIIPKNNMPVVLFALALTMFLAALDQTIVATALSTISRDLDGTTGSLSWVSGAYLLCITAMAPISGKVSDYVGRKAVLYTAIVIFIIGSALCGAAQNMIWLCVCRGVQGIGGGMIVQIANIVLADITPLETRGRYTGVIGATWGVAACVGPLIGGILSQKASWRWCFWVNLPCAGVALLLLIFFLKLNPPQAPKISFLLANFDFLGLGLLVSGLVVLLFGFTSGETNWSSAQTIACLVVGVCVLGAAVVVELKTKRSPVIPPRLFRIRTAAGLFVGVFLHSFSFISFSYYEPLYFQALGATPLMSGVLLMPFSVGTAVFGVIAGFIVAKIKRTKESIIVCYLLCVLGFALLATLNENSSRVQQMMYLLVAAIGVGPLFQLPMLHLQASMPQRDMATSTATLALMRSIGGTVGISVAGAIYANRLEKGLGAVEGYRTGSGTAAVGNVQGLTSLEPPELRHQVLHAYARALSFPWIICAPLLAIAFLASLIIKHYSYKRGTTAAVAATKAAGDEKEAREPDARDDGDEEKEAATEVAAELGMLGVPAVPAPSKDLEAELEQEREQEAAGREANSERPDARKLPDMERGGRGQ